MQVFGGMGYVEETGVAQFYRDVRVTAIYEGTNGIQAMDMVGRKLADGGAAAQALIEEVEETARQAAGDLGARLAAAARRLAEATGWMAAAETNDRFAGAVPYLRAFALTLGGHYLLKAAPPRATDGPRRGAGGLPHPPAAAAGGGALRRGLRGGGAALRARPRRPECTAAAAVRYPFPEPPGAGEAVEIAEGVLWLRLPLPFRPDHLNVYALDDGDGWTLVDTGLDTAGGARGLGGAARRAARRAAGARG